MENTITGAGEEELVEAVFERVKPELVALKAEELVPVSLDIPAGVATVLGVLPEVRALRDEFVTHLPTFDITQLDKLEDYALALSYAHMAYQATTQPPDYLDALTEDATRLRDLLQAEARALMLRGVVSDDQLEKLSGTKGYKNLATDLQLLAGVMKGVWSQIQGKTPTTAGDLESASRVATRLLRVVGLREQGPARIAEATEMRQRAFVKMTSAYKAVRLGVAYLRPADEAADKIAPALHPGRPRRQGKDDVEVVDGSTTPGGIQTSTSAASNGVTAGAGGSTTPVAATPADGGAAASGSTSASGPFLQ